MKIQIRAVGRMRDRRMEDLCGEYLKRAGRHLPIEVLEVAEGTSCCATCPPGRR